MFGKSKKVPGKPAKPKAKASSRVKAPAKVKPVEAKKETVNTFTDYKTIIDADVKTERDRQKIIASIREDQESNARAHERWSRFPKAVAALKREDKLLRKSLVYAKRVKVQKPAGKPAKTATAAKAAKRGKRA